MFVSHQTTDRPLVSVIVPTMNRAHILETVCLTSLATQELPGSVELIVCDASGDTATEMAVREWGEAHPLWTCTCTRAIRRGSCSQRNQAIRLSRGTLLLFLDDDVELLPRALLEVWDASQAKAKTFAGFQILLVAPTKISRSERVRHVMGLLYFSLWGINILSNKRRVLSSGINVGGRPIPRETAQNLSKQAEYVTDIGWMTGCCMAVRREVFFDLGQLFDERLERFGGYASGDDAALSLAIRMRLHLRLVECRRAWAIHHSAPGDRMSQRPHLAATTFNNYLLWRMGGNPLMWRRLSYMWVQVGMTVSCLLGLWGSRDHRTDQILGLLDGWKAIKAQQDEPRWPPVSC